MSLAGLFRSKVTVHDNTPEQFLKLTKKCMEAVQVDRRKRIAPSGISTPYFHYEQCKYLADKLKLAVESSQSFLMLFNKGSPSPDDFANCLKVFKLVHDLANIVENFIRSCCQDAWIQAAMLLNNVSKHISSLGFNLEVLTQSFLQQFPFRIVDSIYGVEVEIVKEMASIDREVLLRDVSTLLQTRKSTTTEYQLATLLLERLQQSMDQMPFEIGLQARLQESFQIDEESLKEMKQIGKGSFATVYKAMWLGVEVAKKTFYVRGSPDVVNEVSILQRLSHPNITSLLGYAKGDRECSIIMELMDEDLFTLIQRRMKEYKVRGYPFDIFEAIDLMLQIGGGMEYLREMRIIHRDLKSMNILVKHVKAKNSRMHYMLVKVADFGLSKTKEESLTNSNQTPNLGTPRWMAPEMIKLHMDERQVEISNVDAIVAKYPFNSDVYSFAMVCYEILTGETPYFEEPNLYKVKSKVLMGDRPELPNRCHQRLRCLIDRCWSSDASIRPCFGEICRELRHLKCLLLMSSLTTQVTPASGQIKYNLAQILAITNDFAKMLGKGRFGVVYYGKLANGQEVAVKVVIKDFEKILKEFMKVEIFQKIHHENLVSLVGYCNEGDELILLYKYMALGTVQTHLYGGEKKKELFLDWKTRLHIALNSAKGLEYLHVECNPMILHLNFKSNNIMLNSNLIAKVADFGLPNWSKLLWESSDDISTFERDCYLDPEYYISKNLTNKSDVYAFGFVLLELICAQPPVTVLQLPGDQLRLDDQVRTCLMEDRIEEIVDPSLGDRYNLDVMWKVAELAMQCVEPQSKHRPNISTIVQELEAAMEMQKLNPMQLKHYSLGMLQIATKNFKYEIGSGGFGKVYKAELPNGTLLAVKHGNIDLNPFCEQQFQAEVQSFNIRTTHGNLLRLYGFCTTPTERFLVYPYMSNGSVSSQLKKPDCGELVLSLKMRKRIALGVAKGLAYLHEECSPKIIHRDVKADNILLDDEFEPLVADFGLIKFPNTLLDDQFEAVVEDVKMAEYLENVNEIVTSIVTSQVQGTSGHIAPEYLYSGEISVKNDVYGYVITLLQLITGQGAINLSHLANNKDMMMLDLVKHLVNEDKVELMVDPNLKEYSMIDIKELLQVALLCTQRSPSTRPKMSEVVSMLEGNSLDTRWVAWLESSEVVSMLEGNNLDERWVEWDTIVMLNMQRESNQEYNEYLMDDN